MLVKSNDTHMVGSVQQPIISRTPHLLLHIPLFFLVSPSRIVGKAISEINVKLLAFHDEFSYDTYNQRENKGGLMKIGYMRISKGEQTTDLQEDALASALCEKTFRDVMSGAKDERPQFLEMLEFARPGDTIVVWRLDRLGRSLKHLIETVMDLQARGINFLSLTESIDTSTPGGKFTFHLFGALAEMERALIQQRTQAGLQASHARGRIGSRPKATQNMDPKKVQRAKEASL